VNEGDEYLRMVAFHQRMIKLKRWAAIWKQAAKHEHLRRRRAETSAEYWEEQCMQLENERGNRT